EAGGCDGAGCGRAAGRFGLPVPVDFTFARKLFCRKGNLGFEIVEGVLHVEVAVEIEIERFFKLVRDRSVDVLRCRRVLRHAASYPVLAARPSARWLEMARAMRQSCSWRTVVGHFGKGYSQ